MSLTDYETLEMRIRILEQQVADLLVSADPVQIQNDVALRGGGREIGPDDGACLRAGFRDREYEKQGRAIRQVAFGQPFEIACGTERQSPLRFTLRLRPHSPGLLEGLACYADYAWIPVDSVWDAAAEVDIVSGIVPPHPARRNLVLTFVPRADLLGHHRLDFHGLTLEPAAVEND